MTLTLKQSLKDFSYYLNLLSNSIICSKKTAFAPPELVSLGMSKR